MTGHNGADREVLEMAVEPLEQLEFAVEVAIAAASGLYTRVGQSKEEFRLDVDGYYAQQVASGVIPVGLQGRIDWLARLTAQPGRRWTGPIIYKNGVTASFPYTQVDIAISGRTANVTFRGSGVQLTRTYKFRSPAFRQVEFEFDRADGVTLTKSIGTHDHPNRPSDLPNETLSLETVYARAGFAVASSGGNSIVPLAGAGPNQQWNNAELHDAMQKYWSRFAPRAQWSLWTFFAAMHEMGSSLGGIMFDDIGPNHRQGTALFTQSFIANAPAGDPAPAAWVKRMIFWTAAHEMGHAFNLAHSWQKSLGVPWVPLANEPEARSFMNYPFRVAGGQTAFFRDFQFRFSDAELVFLRHAPAPFVQMGNAAWFDHHGFQQANTEEEPRFRLVVRANREPCAFDFLEPVVLELKLTNITDEPRLVPASILVDTEHRTVIVKKNNREAREFVPFSRACHQERNVVLDPGESLYESLFVSVGRNGWDVADPGYYLVQIALRVDEEDVVSEPLLLKVLPPNAREEERLACDYFTEEVGRVLTFDGSRHLDTGNQTLAAVVDTLPTSRAATHAGVALLLPRARPFLELDLGGNGPPRSAVDAGGRVSEKKADPKALSALANLLLGAAAPASAAQTLGHIDFRGYAEATSEAFALANDAENAAKVLDALANTLAKRGVPPSILRTLKGNHPEAQAVAGGAARKTKPKGKSKH